MEPGPFMQLDAQRLFKRVRDCDPRINRSLVSEESLARAQRDLDVVLTLLNKDLPENQYTLHHIRDVRHIIQVHRDLKPLRRST